MKSVFLAIALLLSASLAVAQDAEPEEKPAAAQAAKPKRKPPAVQAAKPVEKPVQKPPGSLEIVQIFGIKQIDPASYEIDAQLKNGEPVKLRMNAFVMQTLGKMLGTFGR